MEEYLKFVMVGHVDHGKSTLIGRLLYDTDSLPDEKIEEVRRTCKELGREMEFGFVMDHLEEERLQGITIDTSQTFFKTGRRHYVIIDAPGHKEYVKNMITGASQAEAAILIVDACEGVKEQTKRHAYLLSMLGLNQVIVAINKMDKVDYAEGRFDDVKTEIGSFLSSLGVLPKHTIPISALNGDNVAFPSENMPWHEGPTVLDALDTFLPRESGVNRPLRFPVQDIYKVKDKRILVGRVEAGKIRQGDELVFLPQGSKASVHTIEMLWKTRTEAEAGESIGITLTEPLLVERGAVGCSIANTPMVTSSLRANIFWMSTRPFTASDELMLRLSTQQAPVRIRIERKIDSSTLEPITSHGNTILETEVAEVFMEIPRPFVVESFQCIQELGRFVLTRGLDVVAGGVITSPLS
jgi:sulfate adenylyltransferase subunit 1